ncbi:uncharacterized protein LOC126791797 [Argentina anserina]|uniref:uncharacterized protein LOC126791797 n=1 Tax=Argentina anserina TaxID=57926 RepID=UPI00217673AC|nr:uncharacterized protein LOC126791797 [Potentilla anserina]
MESRVLVLTHPPPHPRRPPRYSLHSLFQNPPPLSIHSLRSYTTRYRRWDSNAETIRSKTFGFSFRDKRSRDEDEDEYEEDDEFGYDTSKEGKRKKRRWWSEMEDGPFEVVDQAIDSVWIFKVFKSYGWAFPFIIISLLLSSGPKAFLMALALPLGQSALSMAFEKLWGRTRRRPRRKSRMRRKPSAASEAGVRMDDEEAYDEYQETDDKKMGYQSWVVGNDASVDNSGEDATSLGGWDDLERMQFERRQSRRKSTGKSKLSRRERNSDTPLLLRLLIAVFPFLGSWTKIFW